MLDIKPHSKDWCHLCGKRQKQLADVWYPHNAEYPGRNNPDRYVRVCDECAQAILDTAKKA
jgi:hypothetical protein